jgi:isoaspartyl peptidase/L-asparaginase-like protein (Ntn-hydrolase superfamily)
MGGSVIHPIAVATWEFGLPAVEAAGEVLAAGGAALDAVEAGINVVELDPSVQSVGYGGLPNADGVVELDAAIMEGGARRAGAVAALRGIRRPVSVARRVMEKTPHLMLAGSGALEFARAEGFPEEELLTAESRRRWQERSRDRGGHDTVGLVALDAAGHLAAGCSTSGLPFKLPGRVGDSPLVGAGLYAEDEVGAAAATGRGEEILKVCASFLVVELMRDGASPTDACRMAAARARDRAPEGDDVMVALIAVSPSGEVGAAATRPEFPYAVWTPAGAELRAVE